MDTAGKPAMRADRKVPGKIYRRKLRAGESIVQMEVTGRYCGIMTLHMDRLRVYDYLSLFSRGRRMDGIVEVAVYPQEKALQLEFSSGRRGGRPASGEDFQPWRGNWGRSPAAEGISVGGFQPLHSLEPDGKNGAALGKRIREGSRQLYQAVFRYGRNGGS